VPEVLPLIEALSAADGSVGWVAMIGTASQMFCTRVQRPTFDKIFVDGIDVPRGRRGHAGRTGGTGRWRLSGLRALAVRERLPGRAVDRGSLRRLQGRCAVMLPAERWRIEDRWHAFIDEDHVDLFVAHSLRVPGIF
jgi:indole-3-acetate monooxygenase